MACPLAHTAEGCELQFGTNHIGHFLLTCMLVPALKSAAPSRVVNLASHAHAYSPVVFDDINFERRPYDKFEAYGQSKTANVLFSVELNRRLSRDGVTANAVHPGGILTPLGRHMSEDDMKEAVRRASKRGELRLKSVAAGAATTIWAATSPTLADRGGLYLENCSVAEPCDLPVFLKGYRRYATDPEAASHLWHVSEAITGQVFDFQPLGANRAFSK